MDSPLFEILNQLDVLGLLVLALAGLFMVYLALTSKVYALFFFLVLGASLTGSKVSLFDNLGSIIRWIAVLLLFLSSLFLKRISLSLGPLLCLGYAAFGFIFIFFSISDSWQYQKSVLLIVVAAAIPLAYGNRSWRTFRLSLFAVAIAATIFSIYNFMSLPGHLNEAVRLSGSAKGAPWFAMVLGGLLPFSLWGVWNISSRVLRLMFGAGFLLGTITLIFSGQRAGTVAGLLGAVPLILMNFRSRKTVGWTILTLIALSSLGFFLLQQSSSERKDFLVSRYERKAGTSGREAIWEEAMAEINKNPLAGRGTGAAEQIYGESFHNSWLEVWYNTGLPGLILFIAAQIYFFYRIYFLGRSHKDPEARSVLALAMGYMLGFLVLCMFESVGAGASNINVILYLFLGVLVSKKMLLESPVQRDVDSETLTEAEAA
jgi:O-antigen ligase